MMQKRKVVTIQNLETTKTWINSTQTSSWTSKVIKERRNEFINRKREEEDKVKKKKY
jgi:hypothetical protein